ncbi:MAG: autotransporter-associated beta strand repeat-containing protein, partial [Thermoguttaceae bacterium]
MTISNNNSFTGVGGTFVGAITINGGTISIASDGAAAAASPLGTVPSSVVPNNIVLNGGALSASASLTLNSNRGIVLGPVSGTGTGYIDVADGQTLTYAGVIANNYNVSGSCVGSLTKTGSGTLLLTGANVHTGDTEITGGTLTLGNSNALQYSTLNYDNANGTITFTGTTAFTLGGLKGTQTLTLNNDSGAGIALSVGNYNVSTTFSGNLNGGGALYKVGTGVQTLTGTSSYSGNTYIGGSGTSTAPITSSLVYSGSASLNNNNTLIIGYRAYDFGAVTFTDNATASLSNLDFGNNLASGGGILTISGSANVVVMSTFNLGYTQGGQSVTNNTVNLNGGTLSVYAFSKTMTTDAARHQATINFNGGTLASNAGGVILPLIPSLTANVQTGGAKIDDGGFGNVQIDQPLIHAAALTGTDGGLTKSGIGTLILTGTNTYNGGTTVNAGTLQLGYNSTTLSSGTLGTGAVLVNASGTLSFNCPNSFTFNNTITGSGNIVQQGAGTVVLSAANALTGAVSINSGATLALPGVQAASGVTVNSGGTLAAPNGGTTINALTLGAGASDTQTLSCIGSSITPITVSGLNALTANGTTFVNPGPYGPEFYVNGVYPLVVYNGAIQGGGFPAFSLALPIRIVGALQNNPGEIDLSITGVKYPRWTGAVNNGSGAGDWDIGTINPITGLPVTGTQNWKEYSTIPVQATVYQEA